MSVISRVWLRLPGIETDLPLRSYPGREQERSMFKCIGVQRVRVRNSEWVGLVSCLREEKTETDIAPVSHKQRSSNRAGKLDSGMHERCTFIFSPVTFRALCGGK